MKVSVIIPTRNRLGYLKEAVASVSAQDYQDRETIVVDDASEDGTWEWLSSLDDPRVRVYRLPRHGERSTARNLGLSNARGEYVMFLDDDDLLAPGALADLGAGVARSPKALAVAGQRLYFDQTGRRYTYPHPKRTIVRKIWSDVLFGWVPVSSQCMLRKTALLEAGGWDQRLSYAEDHELWLRMMTSESIVVVLPGIVAHYRVHAGQTPAGTHCEGYRSFLWSFAERLPGQLSGRAKQIIRARRLDRIAAVSVARRRYGKASGFYAAAILTAPRLLLSPLVGPGLVRKLGGALLGWMFGPKSAALVQQAKVFLGRFNLSQASRRDVL